VFNVAGIVVLIRSWLLAVAEGREQDRLLPPLQNKKNSELEKDEMLIPNIKISF
jgi:hypothetical protein